MDTPAKAPRFKIVRLEERIAPGSLGGGCRCDNGSSHKKSSHKKSSHKKSSHKKSSHKKSSHKGGGGKGCAP